MRFCGYFHFKLRYSGFTKPSGLGYLEISSNFNAVCGVVMFFCVVLIFSHSRQLNGHMLHSSKEGEYQIKESFSLNQED